MVITSVTVKCATQLIFQRMAQVLMVVTSHTFLNLRGSDPRAQESTESNDVTFGSLVHRNKTYQALLSLDAWFLGPAGEDIQGGRNVGERSGAHLPIVLVNNSGNG